jgi:hypothetical protein
MMNLEESKPGMDYVFITKPDVCPNCGSKNIATYLYGLPIMEMVADKIKSGEIILGGCFRFKGQPKWKCKDCAVKMYQPDAL